MQKVFLLTKVLDKEGSVFLTNQELIRAAIEARKESYSPYSGYQVGAALLTESGKVYTGCNIENATYTPTICAERTAIFKAVSEGEKTGIKIAIVGSPEGELIQFAFPCGVCRQVMMEFFDPKTFQVIVAKSEEEFQQFSLEEMLPSGFSPSNLNK